MDRRAPPRHDFAAWVRKNRLAVSAVHVSLFVSVIILIKRSASDRDPAQGLFQFGNVCGVRNARRYHQPSTTWGWRSRSSMID